MKNQVPSATASPATPGRVYSLIVIGFAVFVACLTFDALRTPISTDSTATTNAPATPKTPEASDSAGTKAEFDSQLKEGASATMPVATALPLDAAKVDRKRFSELLVIAGLSALAAFFLPGGQRAAIEGKRPVTTDADAIAEATGLPVLGELFPGTLKSKTSSPAPSNDGFNVRRTLVLVGELTLCLGFAVAIAGSASQPRIANQFPTDPLNAYADSVRSVTNHVNSWLN